MNNQTRLLAGLWIVLLICLFTGCDREREYINPTYIQINEAVYSNAIILPEFEYRVFSPVAGIIDKVYVEEGDTVKSGDLLFKIKDDNIQLATQAAAIDVALAQASLESQNDILDELKREIDIAKSKVEFDSIQFKRQDALWAQQIGTRAELDAKQLSFNTSKRQLYALISKYNRLERELTFALKKSKTNLETARINSADFLVKARIDGIVYGIFKEEGESTNNQQALAELGSSDKFIIEMEVDEFDISRIKLGQKIALQLDAFSDSIFEGTLQVIYPKLNPGTKSFTVEGTFNTPPKPLYSGLSGEANILIGQKDSALVIPTAYLKAGNKVEGEDGDIKVEIGVQNMNYTEIIDGLGTESKVYLPSDEN